MKKFYLSNYCFVILLIFVNSATIFSQQLKFEIIDPNSQAYYNITNNQYLLTTNTQDQRVALWNDYNQGNDNINLNQDFCLKFKCQFSNYNHDEGADGIVFIMRNPELAPNNLGSLGGGIGYIGVSASSDRIFQSYAIEFDTYDNGSGANYFDQSYDHFSYIATLSPQLLPLYRHDGTYSITPSYEDVENSKWYNISINWVALTKTLSTTVNDNPTISVVIPTLISDLGTNIIRWGFTSATGDKYNGQSIKIESLKRELCCNVDLKILRIGNINNENINDIYPNYNYNNFGGPLKVCSGTSVTFRADVDPGVSRVEWWKKEFDANGGSTETLVDTQFPPTDYYDKEFVFNEDYSTMIIAKVVYNNGCEASENMTVIPIQFMIQLPPNKFLCAETETYIEPSIVLTNTSDGWITWEWTEDIIPSGSPSLIEGPTNENRLLINTGNAAFNKATYKLKATYHEKFNNSQTDDFVMTCEVEGLSTIIYNNYYSEISVTRPVCNDCSGQLKVKINGEEKSGPTVTYQWNVDSPQYDEEEYFSSTNYGYTSDNFINIQLPRGVTSAKYKVKVTVTDENNMPCVSYAEITVNLNDFKILDVSGKDICNEGDIVEWEVFHTDCNPDYTYEWEYLSGTFPPEEVFENGTYNTKRVQLKKAGNYKVRITNSTGCIIEKEFEVINKNFGCDVSLEPEVNENDVTTNYNISLQVFGGKRRFDIEWYDFNKATSNFDRIPVYSDGDFEVINGLINHKYKVWVQDANGCSCEKIIEIIDPGFQAHENYVVCKGESVQLKTFKYSGDLDINTNEETTLGGYNLIWEPFDFLDKPIDNLEPISTPDRDINYKGTLFFKQFNSSTNTLTIGQKIVKCIVKVVESSNDFIKEVSLTTNALHPIYYFNGLSPTRRISYQQETDFDCGFLIYGVFKDDDCASYGFANITKQDAELNNKWSENYFKQNINGNYEIFSEVINIFEKPSSTSIGVEKKISTDYSYLAIGGYTSNYEGNNQDLILLKLNSVNGSLTSSKIIQSSPTSYQYYNEYAYKAIQSKDLKYIYLLGLIKYSNQFLFFPNESENIIVYKINSDDLSIVARTYLEKIDEIDKNGFKLSATDIVEDKNGDLIITGEWLYYEGHGVVVNPILIKLNPNLNIVSSKYVNINSSYYGASSSNIFEYSSNGDFVVTSTVFNSGYLNPYIYRLDNSLNYISGSGFFVNHDFNTDINLKSSILTSTGKINLLLTNLAKDINIARVDYMNKVIDKQIYYEEPSSEECYQPVLSPRKNIIRQGFEGATLLTGFRCYDENQYFYLTSNSYLMKMNNLTNLYFSPSSCISLLNYSTSNNDIITYDAGISTSDLNYHQSSGYDEIFGNNLNKNDLCSAPICHCDENRIKVNIVQEEDPANGECKFTFSFDKLNYIGSCNIVDAQLILGSEFYTLNSIFSEPRPEFTEIFTSFTDSKTIIINYFDANGNIVCSTSKVITCACSCEDYQQIWNKLEFNFEQTSETPEECCYDLYIDNTKNNCAFKNDGILINLPESLLGDNLIYTPDINSDWDYLEDDPHKILILYRGSDQINGGSSIKVGTVCLKRTNETKTINIKIDNYECTKEWKQDLGCVKSCCEDIAVGTEFTNSTSSENECCYTINVSLNENISNCASNLKMLIKYNGKVLQEVGNLQPFNSVIICIPAEDLKDLPSQFELIADFVTEENNEFVNVCSKTLPTITKCTTCCDRIHLNVDSEPSMDDGTVCCFDFSLTIDEDERCGDLKQIKIFDDYGNLIWVSAADEVFSTGANVKHFCVSKDDFNEASSLNLNFKFYNQEDEEFCNDKAEINACNDIPSGCTPDFEEVPWKYGHDSFSFNCGDDENAPKCVITYNYQFRHVISGGISMHRDIQITSFTYNPDCACIDEAIAAMFQSILENPEVIDEFKISQELNFPPSSTKCINNFRLITSDCWHEIATSDRRVILAGRCPGTVCCYSIYEVCFRKDNLGYIIPPVTFSKINNYFVPVGCSSSNWPPCEPNNCTKFAPNSSDDVPVEIRTTAKIGIDLNDENSIQTGYAILQKNFDNEFDIAIMNDLKGIVQIEFTSLLGNIISEYQLNKDRKAFNENITTNLSSGIYFCVLKINNQIIGTKKILVIK